MKRDVVLLAGVVEAGHNIAEKSAHMLDRLTVSKKQEVISGKLVEQF